MGHPVQRYLIPSQGDIFRESLQNLFFDNANKPSDVTLDSVDYFQFSAHKGSKIWSHSSVDMLMMRNSV